MNIFTEIGLTCFAFALVRISWIVVRTILTNGEP